MDLKDIVTVCKIQGVALLNDNGLMTTSTTH